MTSVNLSKGEHINLSKKSASPLRRIRIGLGWDAAKRGLFGASREIDLDASILTFQGKENREIVFYNHLRSSDGAIQHMGDNLTGDGDGDDEVIIIDLGAVDSRVDGAVVTITSYSGQKFSEIQNAFVRVLNDETGEEIARYTLSKGNPSLSENTALLAGKLNRSPEGDWEFTALGLPANSRVPTNLISPAAEVI